MTTSTTPAAAADTAAGQPLVNPSTKLGEHDFLQLLVAQLRYQDPLSPVDDQAFVSEQAQFSLVEGVTNLERSLERLVSATQLAQSVALIGKQVTYTAADGSAASGVVDGVSTDGGAPLLRVGGAAVDPAAVVAVGAAPPSGGSGA
ncbi:MAG TPA: flagellar hook capping FlgD N-terminal domain-containing protein [Gaiellaceae bacterium]|nr:flagellar hook capping FlgD N-terminal domain-containing protein [Gaiellaceae bacterium]